MPSRPAKKTASASVSTAEAAFRIVEPARSAEPLTELGNVGFADIGKGGLRIAVKPNLTWVDPRPGVTTSYEVLAATVTALREAGNEVRIVESNGGYGTFSADACFDRHGLRDLASSSGAELVNLSTQPTEIVELGGVTLEMPRLLLHDTDYIVSMPVPKVHVMTRFTGAVKNQWGLIPSDMRLRRHYRLPDILAGLLRALPRQAVVMDATFFLDETGPLEGLAIPGDMLVFASHPLIADAVALRLMGWDVRTVPYLWKVAHELGIDLTSIEDLPEPIGHHFSLHRTFWNWVALAGFRSRVLTYIGYESPLAGPLHGLKALAERAAPKGGSDPSR